MNITAAVVDEKGGPFALQEVQLGELRPDELLIKVQAAGICHTDIVVRDQWYPVPLPAVLGHEGGGIVEQVGTAVSGFEAGDHVSLSFNSCGVCRPCLIGRPSYCADFFGRNFGSSRPDGTSGISRDGGPIHGNYFGQSSFGTYAIANVRSAVKLPKDIPFEVVAPFGCGIQTGAGSVLNSLRPPAGSSIVVFGAGSVGLAAVMAANLSGCTTIIAVDLVPARLEKARELGATHTIDGRTEDSVARIIEITGGGADFSLECTASPKVLRQALECLAPIGRLRADRCRGVRHRGRLRHEQHPHVRAGPCGASSRGTASRSCSSHSSSNSGDRAGSRSIASSRRTTSTRSIRRSTMPKRAKSPRPSW